MVVVFEPNYLIFWIVLFGLLKRPHKVSNGLLVLCRHIWIIFERYQTFDSQLLPNLLFYSLYTKNAFFVCFRPYVEQPDNHIGWTAAMSFASIFSTQLRTQPGNLAKKYWESAVLKNSVFLSRPVWIFFPKLFFLLHPHENQSKFIG